MIPVEQIALIYNTDIKSIKKWVKKHQITSSRIGDQLMIDEVSLERVIELNATISRYDEYLEEILLIKQKELMTVILRIDDLIYLFKSIKNISPLLQAVVNEMAQLIPDESKRNIFMEVLLSKNLSEVAKKHNLYHQTVSYLYDSALTCIHRKLGFLTEYRKTIAKLKFECRRLEIENRNQEEKINYLMELFKSVNHKDFSFNENLPERNIPAPVVKMLSKRFDKDFQMDVRIINSLHWAEIDTVEDLLRYIQTHPIEDLLEIRNFGMKSFSGLKKFLIEQGLMDKNGQSYLFRYLK